MGEEQRWTRDVYEGCLSSGCWWYTPYDDGWVDGKGIAVDEELTQIVWMEKACGTVPEWAGQIVRVWINYLPPCGHYLFPRPLLEIVSATGEEDPGRFRPSCYRVERSRKRAAQDYCLCLDAWLAGAGPEAVAVELGAFSGRKIDWLAVCRDLWGVLGERSEAKELLVERTLHAMRAAIKDHKWADDAGGEFGRDQYLGDYAIRADKPYPSFKQAKSPRLDGICRRLSEVCPNWQQFSRVDHEDWWLCAPKAFRFLERDLWAIGQGRPLGKGASVPGFLRCEDTWPEREGAARWYRAFRAALRGWWQGEEIGGDAVAGDVAGRLGERTAVKQWLVRLLLHKLTVLEANGEQFARLVGRGRSL